MVVPSVPGAASVPCAQDGYVLLSFVESVKPVPSGMVLRFAKPRLRDAAHSTGGLLQLEVYRAQGQGSGGGDRDAQWARLSSAVADAVTRVGHK